MASISRTASAGSRPASASRAARSSCSPATRPPDATRHSATWTTSSRRRAPCASTMSASSLLDAAQAQRRQPGAQHLAVERVRQAHGRAAARRDDPDEPVGLERLERRRAVGALEVGEAEALAHGQQLEHGAPGGVDAGQVLGDELVERGRRRQRADQVPDAAGVDEHAAFAGAAHELGEHLQVAAREPGQLGRARAVDDRAVERAVEQRAELVGRRAARAPCGRGDRRDASPVSRGERLRPVRTVPTRNTVRDMISGTSTATDVSSSRSRSSTSSTSRSSPGQPAQLGPRGVEEGRALVVADADVVHELGGQQVGEGAERDRLRRRVADGAFDAAGRPARRGATPPRPGGSCRPRPGRAARRRRPPVAVVAAELLELGRAPGERPQRDHRIGRYGANPFAPRIEYINSRRPGCHWCRRRTSRLARPPNWRRRTTRTSPLTRRSRTTRPARPSRCSARRLVPRALAPGPASP